MKFPIREQRNTGLGQRPRKLARAGKTGGRLGQHDEEEVGEVEPAEKPGRRSAMIRSLTIESTILPKAAPMDDADREGRRRLPFIAKFLETRS